MNTLEKKIDALVRLSLCEDADEKEVIRKSLRDMMAESETPTTVSTHDKVMNALLELGTPDHIKGHKYLICAVEMAIENPEVTEMMTKVLYPEVAKKYRTTASRTERAIRHAIEVTWDRGEYEVLAKYFGNTVSPRKGKPTNSEFISRMANALK